AGFGAKLTGKSLFYRVNHRRDMFTVFPHIVWAGTFATQARVGQELDVYIVHLSAFNPRFPRNFFLIEIQIDNLTSLQVFAPTCEDVCRYDFPEIGKRKAHSLPQLASEYVDFIPQS